MIIASRVFIMLFIPFFSSFISIHLNVCFFFSISIFCLLHSQDSLYFSPCQVLVVVNPKAVEDWSNARPFRRMSPFHFGPISYEPSFAPTFFLGDIFLCKGYCLLVHHTYHSNCLFYLELSYFDFLLEVKKKKQQHYHSKSDLERKVLQQALAKPGVEHLLKNSFLKFPCQPNECSSKFAFLSLPSYIWFHRLTPS